MKPFARHVQFAARTAAVLGFLSFLAPAAAACPFCYSKAMSSTAGLLQAFRSGIIILMVPPFVMSIAFTVVAYRRRNCFHQPAGQSPDLEKH